MWQSICVRWPLLVYVLKFVWLWQHSVPSSDNRQSCVIIRGGGTEKRGRGSFLKMTIRKQRTLLLSAPQKKLQTGVPAVYCINKETKQGITRTSISSHTADSVRSYAIILMSTKKRHPKNRRQRIENKELELWTIMIQVTMTMNGH